MNVLIIGGSIAGLAAALALARQGHRVAVHERRHTADAMGAGVILWPPAGRHLADLSLLDALGDCTLPLGGMLRHDLQGRQVDALDFGASSGERAHRPLAVLRRDLIAVLQQAARAHGIDLRHASTVSAIVHGGNRREPARTRGADGRLHEADLIIGADGRMRSTAADFVRGGQRPVDHGLVSWVGTLPQGGRRLQGRIHDFWARGIRFGMVPAGADSLYWAAAARADLAPPLTDMPRNDLRALLAGAAEMLTEVIDATPEADVHRYRLHDIEPGLPWLRDRVLLIGDAAHASLPTSGQGAAQALEDAWQLACAIGSASAWPELEPRLHAFVAARVEDARRVTWADRTIAAQLADIDRPPGPPSAARMAALFRPAG